MIIFGSNIAQLNGRILREKCPNCGTQNAVDLRIYQKYAHIFWVPTFPLSKTAVSQCKNCKQTLQLNEMSSTLMVAFQNLNSETRRPIWVFSGIFLILLVIGGIFLGDTLKGNRVSKYGQDLRKGDVLDVKLGESQFIVYRVHDVVDDSVFLDVSKFESNLASGVDQIKVKGFLENSLHISKTDIKSLIDQEMVLDIYRK